MSIEQVVMIRRMPINYGRFYRSGGPRACPTACVGYVAWFNVRIIALYAQDMTTQDIRAHMGRNV